MAQVFDHRLDAFLDSECELTTREEDATYAVYVQHAWHVYIAGPYLEALRRLERQCRLTGPGIYVWKKEGYVRLRDDVLESTKRSLADVNNESGREGGYAAAVRYAGAA
jgi:hypothetical protein